MLELSDLNGFKMSVLKWFPQSKLFKTCREHGFLVAFSPLVSLFCLLVEIVFHQTKKHLIIGLTIWVFFYFFYVFFTAAAVVVVFINRFGFGVTVDLFSRTHTPTPISALVKFKMH